MEFDRFHQFGSLLLHDDFVVSYSGYVTEDILEAVGATLRQRLADHIDNLKRLLDFCRVNSECYPVRD